MKLRQLRSNFPRFDGPARPLLAGTFAYALGRGMYSTGGIVFFTLSFGLPVQQIAVALSGAGIAACAAALPAGYLTDRWGPRRMALVMTTAQVVLLAPLLLSGSPLIVLPVVVALGAADRVNSIARRALVSEVMGESARVRTQAYMRTMANTGMSLGALAVAPLLAVGTRSAFVFLIVLTCGAYLLALVATARLPARLRTSPSSSVSPSARRRQRSRAALPERQRLAAFMTLGLLNGLFALHISVLEVALPLWVTRHTDAPAWTVAALVFVNTVLAILLQVRASRGATSVGGAARALAVSAVFTALACILFATTAAGTGVLVIGTLCLATVVLTAGELLQSAGEWGLSFGLAPAQAQGRYIGAFSVGTTLQDIVGPTLVGAVVVAYVPGGWLLLSAVLLAGAAVVIPMTRWVANLHADRDGHEEQVPVPLASTASSRR
ncbi:MFS transporter [Streptomyces albospinus]|uniref:MFS transporter n=1 Tax=Streptomyces albospinus TaxID=285515 RepID=A0ABQ2UQ03_9ACTN|nr:MFS transporter [Streptomyces albospinus]GGU48232.1 MFS transporter [Streptomyces albospinus]